MLTSKQNIFLRIFLILSILLFVFFSVFFFQNESKRTKLPFLGKINEFNLVDQNGVETRLKDMRGKVWIAQFFFTTCSDICPMISKNVASLNRSFALVPELSLVSITVNPENDTPSSLQKYAEKYKATKNWLFLTGTREEITKLAVESFKLGDISEPVFHSSYLVLVDKNGLIRGYYDGKDQAAINKLFKEAASILKEKLHGLL